MCMNTLLSSLKKPFTWAVLLAVAALAYTFLYPDADHKVLSESAKAPARTVKIMPLGDSITEGEGADRKNSYRLDLLNDLKEFKIDYVGSFKEGLLTLADHDMQAEGGACIRAYPGCGMSLYEQTSSWIDAFQPDIVIMQGGVNDFCCGRQDDGPQPVRNNLRDWVNVVWDTKPDTYIVVIGMPGGFKTGWGFKDWLPKYVAAEARLGKQIAYVPLDGTESPDGIHPDVEGYKELAGRLAKVLRPVMNDLASDN
jgi:lysophospholipase L1-like esterase